MSRYAVRYDSDGFWWGLLTAIRTDLRYTDQEQDNGWSMKALAKIPIMSETEHKGYLSNGAIR